LGYRSLWWLVGLRSYLPYQLLVVLLHLTVAALLRTVMRRAGASLWVATTTAALFAFFGAGYENIVLGFQIGFDASLVFGLTHLVLADHDGQLDRRDGFGLAAGLAGLLCSGVAVPMSLVVGVAVLFRRSLRIALVHTVPLGVLYTLWSLRFPDSHTTSGVLTFGNLVHFVTSNVRATFLALGQLPGMGVALGVLLAVGAGLLWARARDTAELRVRVGPPIALLVGAFVFLVITGVGRGGPTRFGHLTPEASRYIYVVAALTLPALAVAASAVVQYRRWLAPVVLAMFVVGIPGNITTLADHMDAVAPYQHAFKEHVESLPRVPVAKRVPRWVRPLSVLGPQITVGWLLDAAASGRLAHPAPSTPSEVATHRLQLSIVPDDKHLASNRCRVVTGATSRTLQDGDSITARDPLVYIFLRTAGGMSGAVTIGASPLPKTVITVVPTVTVDIVPAKSGVKLCGRSF
jgi:hypothetical protein